MTDQTAYVEVLARLLCAADVHVHDGDHPSWQELRVAKHGRGQDDYRKAARWLAARLTVASQAPASPPASSAGRAPATDQTALRDRIEVWPLARVLAEVRCGSQDWTWDEEWADLDRRHADTGYLATLEQQIRERGITMPVLIGSDGRLWDGHHRLRIAVRVGIPYVPVEITPPVAVLPAPVDQAAVLERIRQVVHRLAAHAVGFQDVLDESDRGPWGKTIAADIAELRRMADETQPAPCLPPMDPVHILGIDADETRSGPCAHCGKPISRVTGTLAAWWVHDPCGNTICDPQQAASSPRATPQPAAGAQQDGARP